MSSDEELPPAGGMGDDAMDDGSDDDDYEPSRELPDGITKEVITGGDGWKKPKTCDEVTVHYVGTLLTDGSEFDSSRARDKPFQFTLGKGQVIKGWDLGVATMKKGEVAKFTLLPEFAYGDSGSPPKISENATLVFEVELISWQSKDDLFGDEGVIKTQLTEGSGYKTPKEGDEVLLTMKAMTPDGTVIEEKTDIEYVLGSNALGLAANACDKALAGMKKGEEASLKCSKDYAYGEKTPDGATLQLTLKEVYETKDVSFAKDKSMMKKQVKEGEGYEMPKECAKITLSVEAAVHGNGAPVDGFTAKVMDFTAGDGEVCDGLECAVAQMKKGERCVLTASGADLAEVQLGLQGKAGSSDKISLTLEMPDFEKGKDTRSMSEEEQIEFGMKRKEVGGTLFKSGRMRISLERYNKVTELFNHIDNFKAENKTKAKDLKKVCESNKAMCYLKLQDYVEAKKSCNAVLKEDSENVKAMYRRAQAENGLKNYNEAVSDCKRLLDLDAQNKEARALLKVAMAGRKEDDKKSKGLFANMCKALGKGPIPEPGNSSKLFDDYGENSGSDDEPPPFPPPEAASEGADADAVAPSE